MSDEHFLKMILSERAADDLHSDKTRFLAIVLNYETIIDIHTSQKLLIIQHPMMLQIRAQISN